MSLKINASVLAAVFLLPVFVSAQAVTLPTLTLTLSKVSMTASVNSAYATLPSISWTSSNAVSCSASGAGWSGVTSTSGSQKINPSVTTTYTMTCTNASGSITRSATLTVTPAINLQTAGVLGAYQHLMNGTSASTSVDSAPSDFHYVWNQNLKIGSSNATDISALQTALTRAGVFSGEITGGFYSKTFAAVQQFQRNNGIEATGFVGSQTRAKLNSLYGN